jgi:hypothetical protein
MLTRSSRLSGTNGGVKGIYRRSGGANTISSLASSNGAICLNPDGNLVYCK